METAPVVRLKSRLSHYLRRVKAGEEVVVTERGVPIARLVPVGKRTSDLDDLRDLERQGLIRLGTGRLPKDFWTLRRPRDPEGRVLKALLEERESSRKPRWSGRSATPIRESSCGGERGPSASPP